MVNPPPPPKTRQSTSLGLDSGVEGQRSPCSASEFDEALTSQSLHKLSLSPNFWAPGSGFMEGNSRRPGGGGWFQDDSSALPLLCTLFLLLLYQVHLGSSGIR